jgi:hypothetical protein
MQWDFHWKDGSLLIAGRHRLWKMKELVRLDRKMRRHSKQGILVQLHPVSSDAQSRPQSLVPLRMLVKYGQFFRKQPTEKKTMFRIPEQNLKHFRRRNLTKPSFRLRSVPLIWPSASAGATPNRMDSVADTTQDVTQQVVPVLVPTQRAKRSRSGVTRPRQMLVCCICEAETSCVFCLSTTAEGAVPDKCDILVQDNIASNSTDLFCAGCFVHSFVQTGKLPIDLDFFTTFCIFAGSYENFEDQCLRRPEFCEIPEHCTQDFVDIFVREHTLLAKLCDSFMVDDASCLHKCVCHPTLPALGELDPETNTLTFRNCDTIYPEKVLEVQRDGSIQETTKHLPHQTICAQCLKEHRQNEACRIDEHYLNPFYRSPTRQTCKRRLFRNKEISRDNIAEFISGVIFSEDLNVHCPGCFTEIFRSEQCNELNCPNCDYKLCFHCGFAAYQPFPLIDHFSTHPVVCLTEQRCPRFRHNMHSLAGCELQCTSECQSHKNGDCTKPDHQLFLKRLRRKRKQVRIREFVRCLDPARRMTAHQMLKLYAFDYNAPLDLVQNDSVSM